MHFHGGGSMFGNLLIIKSYFSFHLYNIFFSLSLDRKRLVRTVLIFTESSDQLSRATDRVPGLPASPGYVQ
ncbi:hypothetical protein EYY29_10075 [Escherichia coli]|nr:hypothetical protein EYY29_10075 [Escherichia coli]